MKKNRQQFFPGQRQDEKIYKVIRKHWFVYVPFYFFAISMVAVWLVAIFYLSYFGVNLTQLTGMIIIISTSVYTLIMLFILLYGFVNYYLDTYIITDERIVDIVQEGLFKRVVSELHMRQIQDVSAKVDSIFGTMLHFGNVEIQTAGERANFRFTSISYPYRISKLIIDLHEKAIDTSSRMYASKSSSNCDHKPIPTKSTDNSSGDKIATVPEMIKNDVIKMFSGKEEKFEEGILKEGKEADL